MRLLQTWMLLVSATLASAWLGTSELADGQRSPWIALVILTIAITKCRFVIRNFMDVRSAPTWLKRSCDAWLVANFTMMSAYYCWA